VTSGVGFVSFHVCILGHFDPSISALLYVVFFFALLKVFLPFICFALLYFIKTILHYWNWFLFMCYILLVCCDPICVSLTPAPSMPKRTTRHEADPAHEFLKSVEPLLCPRCFSDHLTRGGSTTTPAWKAPESGRRNVGGRGGAGKLRQTTTQNTHDRRYVFNHCCMIGR
jgi:hypothetical protein